MNKMMELIKNNVNLVLTNKYTIGIFTTIYSLMTICIYFFYPYDFTFVSSLLYLITIFLLFYISYQLFKNDNLVFFANNKILKTAFAFVIVTDFLFRIFTDNILELNFFFLNGQYYFEYFLSVLSFIILPLIAFLYYYFFKENIKPVILFQGIVLYLLVLYMFLSIHSIFGFFGDYSMGFIVLDAEGSRKLSDGFIYIGLTVSKGIIFLIFLNKIFELSYVIKNPFILLGNLLASSFFLFIYFLPIIIFLLDDYPRLENGILKFTFISFLIIFSFLSTKFLFFLQKLSSETVVNLIRLNRIGKNLQLIVYLAITMLIFNLLIGLIVFNSKNVDLIQSLLNLNSVIAVILIICFLYFNVSIIYDLINIEKNIDNRLLYKLTSCKQIGFEFRNIIILFSCSYLPLFLLFSFYDMSDLNNELMIILGILTLISSIFSLLKIYNLGSILTNEGKVL